LIWFDTYSWFKAFLCSLRLIFDMGSCHFVIIRFCRDHWFATDSHSLFRLYNILFSRYLIWYHIYVLQPVFFIISFWMLLYQAWPAIFIPSWIIMITWHAVLSWAIFTLWSKGTFRFFYHCLASINLYLNHFDLAVTRSMVWVMNIRLPATRILTWSNQRIIVFARSWSFWWLSPQLYCPRLLLFWILNQVHIPANSPMAVSGRTLNLIETSLGIASWIIASATRIWMVISNFLIDLLSISSFYYLYLYLWRFWWCRRGRVRKSYRLALFDSTELPAILLHWDNLVLICFFLYILLNLWSEHTYWLR